MKFRHHLLAAAMFLTGATVVEALPPGFVDELYLDGFEQAIGLTHDQSGRLYVWEKGGVVWIIDQGVRLPQPLIDLSEEVGNSRDFGLLGVTLDPNFSTNGFIYLLYIVDRHHLVHFGTPSYDANTNDYAGSSIGRVTRYTAEASSGFTSVDLTSRTVLIGESISTGIPSLHDSHGVGSLVFGTDETLLISVGDGASFNSVDEGSAPESYYVEALADGILRADENVGAYRSQMINSLNGKILRIDPATGDGLPSNPHWNALEPRSPASRVWARGLRNPCRMILQPNTGSPGPADGNPGVLLLGDVGWFTNEELNVCDAPGLNFGWPVFEGFTHMPGYNDPAYTPTPHQLPTLDWRLGTARARVGNDIFDLGSLDFPSPTFTGNASIGGAWYNGGAFPSAYADTYFHCDYGAEWIRNVVFDSNFQPVEVRPFADGIGNITALASSPTGDQLIYVNNTGEVRRIRFADNRPPSAHVEADVRFGPGPLTVEFRGAESTDQDGEPLTFLWDFGDGNTSTLTNPSHTFTPVTSDPTAFVVTLTVTDPHLESNSQTLTVSVNNTPPVINSTSIDGVATFSSLAVTVLNLSAVVTDAEHAGGELTYAWQTAFHHDNHAHSEPVDANPTTTTNLSPAHCGDILYFYRITLTVTDAAGLATTVVRDLMPDCDGPTARNDAVTFAPEASTEINVLQNDLASPEPINVASVTVVRLPEHGSTTVDASTWAITYESTSQTALDDWFTYKVSDSMGAFSSVARVDLTRSGPPLLLVHEPLENALVITDPLAVMFQTIDDGDLAGEVQFFLDGATPVVSPILSGTLSLPLPSTGPHTLLAQLFDRHGVALTNPDSSKLLQFNYLNVGPPGLFAEFYEGTDFGVQRLARTDPQVDFDWGPESPQSGVLGPDQFSARWSGFVLPTATEPHTFHVTGDDGFRLWVDGQLVIDRWFTQVLTESSSDPLPLVASEPVPIVLEYFEGSDDASVRLDWSSPGMPQEVIPAANLYQPLSTNSNPTIAIVSPIPWARYADGYATTIVATADDFDGFVDKVAFSVDGVLIDEIVSPPFQTTTSLANGFHELVCTATDNTGQSTSRSVDFMVGDSVTWTFDGDEEGWIYQDDTFQSTSEPDYASGSHTDGFDGGGLSVSLGGVDNQTINGMSGAWTRSFRLAQITSMEVEYRYRLDQTAAYAAGEASQTLFEINDFQVGATPNPYIDALIGNGTAQSTGWQQILLNLAELAAVDLTIGIGALNDTKSSLSQETTLVLDDVSFFFTSKGVAPTATADEGDVPFGQIRTIDVLANDTPGDAALALDHVEILTEPTMGTAEVLPFGLIRYTSTGEVTGSDSFTYRVADIEGDWSAPATVSITLTEPVVPAFLTWDFATGPGEWVYVDDAFRGTSQPDYSRGAHRPTTGITNGALEVLVGGVDDDPIAQMSGGWRYTFTLPRAAFMTVNLNFDLFLDGSYDPGDASEVLFDLNGFLIGASPDDHLDELTGNGSSDDQQTGWRNIFLNLTLIPAGTHSVTVGAFNNEKDESGEVTRLLLDDIEIAFDECFSYDCWVLNHFPGQPATGMFGITANPDGDSLTNLGEFYHDRKLMEPDSAGTYQRGVTTVNSMDYQTYTFRRSRRLPNSVTAEVLRSTDLTGSWATGETVEVGTVDIDSASEWVTYRSTVPMDGQAREFLKLAVSDSESGESFDGLPFGFVRQETVGTADTLFGPPLWRPAAWSGPITSISGNALTIDANLLVDELINGPDRFYVLVSSGSLQGQSFTVVGNGTSTVTVDPNASQDVQSQGLAAGHACTLIPFWSLSTLFTGGQGMVPSSDVFNPVSTVKLYDATSIGINIAPRKTYLLHDGSQVAAGWYDNDRPQLGLQNEVVLSPETFFMVRHPTAVAPDVLIQGQVPDVVMGTVVGRFEDDTTQDNLVINPYPAPFTLGASGLATSGAVEETTASVFNPLDTLKLFADPDGFNPAPQKTYLYYGGTQVAVGWYDNDRPQLGLQDGVEIPAGAPVIIRKRLGPSGTVYWIPPLPYTP